MWSKRSFRFSVFCFWGVQPKHKTGYVDYF